MDESGDDEPYESYSSSPELVDCSDSEYEGEESEDGEYEGEESEDGESEDGESDDVASEPKTAAARSLVASSSSSTRPARSVEEDDICARSSEDDEEDDEDDEEDDICESWRAHVLRFGKHHQKCGRCSWMRQRRILVEENTFVETDGVLTTWLEESSCPGKPWGVGCLVCRLALEHQREHQRALPAPARKVEGTRVVGAKKRKRATEPLRPNIFAVTRARTIAQLEPARLRRHASSRAHKAALLALGKLDAAGGPASKEADRNDVPAKALLYAAYKGARQGHSFRDYEGDVDLLGCTGSNVARSRRGRKVAKKRLWRCMLCCERMMRN